MNFVKLFVCLVMLSGSAFFGWARADATVAGAEGVLLCPGVYNFNGIAGLSTNFVFRNVNSRKNLVISRLRILDAEGNVLRDFPRGDAYPIGVKTVLAAYHTTVFSTRDVLGSAVIGQVTALVSFRSVDGKPASPLHGSANQMIFDADGQLVSLDSNTCQLL